MIKLRVHKGENSARLRGAAKVFLPDPMPSQSIAIDHWFVGPDVDTFSALQVDRYSGGVLQR